MPTNSTKQTCMILVWVVILGEWDELSKNVQSSCSSGLLLANIDVMATSIKAIYFVCSYISLLCSYIHIYQDERDGLVSQKVVFDKGTNGIKIKCQTMVISNFVTDKFEKRKKLWYIISWLVNWIKMWFLIFVT